MEELLALLDKTPAVVNIHPVSLCFLPSDVLILGTEAEATWLLDDPHPVLPQRILITGATSLYEGRFPHIRYEHDPFTPALNSILLERFEDVATRMLCQSALPDRIVRSSDLFDLVLLFLVDGLSYRDVRNWAASPNTIFTIEPCLVDVPTLTQTGFSNIIGDPPVAARLFDRGFHDRLGFTYWDIQDNEMAGHLFHTIPRTEKAGDFRKIVSALREYLETAAGRKCYVQIVRTGLDGYVHNQKRKPPVAEIVADVRREFETLGSLLRELGVRSCLYLTADHGILWRDEFEPKIVGNAPARSSPRWCGWRELYYQEDRGRRFVVGGEEYYCLGFPKVRRPLRIDEQGVHGGISFQESIVPFITWEVLPVAAGGTAL